MNKKKRLHFGVLFTTTDNACLCSIWNGIYDYARVNDIHLTAYFGTYQSTDDDVALHLETCFDTIRCSKSLDGLILFAGFLTKHIDINSFTDYISGVPSHIPAVSISYPMPGIPSVLVDNVAGIYDAVEHLIRVHGKKKIAFIKGPDGHPEAEDRLLGYKNALAANGIIYDEGYVLPGNFSRESGSNAVAELMDKRKLSADAIVASDDETAIGVLSELKNRKIAVPTDVAVTGFNDDRASATFIPSMSTVRQGFFEIGSASAETLCKIINGEQVGDVKYVAPVFMPRQSCGCYEKVFSVKELKREDAPAEGDSLASFALRNIIQLFKNTVPQQQVKTWVAGLIDTLKDKPFDRDKFLHLFDDVLVSFSHYSMDFSLWYEALNQLSASVECYAGEVDCLHTTLSTLFYATTLVYDICLKDEKTNEFHLSDTRVILRRVVNNLIILFDVDSLAEELYRLFPELSLNTTLIGLYRTPVKSTEPDADRSIKTLIGFDGDRKFNISHNTWNPILFSDYSTIDSFDFERERRALFFIPLYFRDEEAGVLLLSYDTQTPVEAYETLRINISTALKGAELMSKIQTLSITDELSGLLNRRGFFQYAYSRIPHLSRDSERMPYVMFMDMDGLKNINDTYGHKEGDAAISAFANILKDTLREEDIIGRIGGDEFVVFSSVKSERDGEQVVKRIRDELDRYNSKKLHPYVISACIGNVVLADTTNECFEAAMLSADSVLYEEKTKKRINGLSRG